MEGIGKLLSRTRRTSSHGKPCSGVGQLSGRPGGQRGNVRRHRDPYRAGVGYPGLADLKRSLVASLEADATPAGDMRRTLDELGEDAILALDIVLATHEEALTTLRSAAFREQLDQALPVLHAAKRIVVFGIGPSAALARYVAVLLTRGGRSDLTSASISDVSGFQGMSPVPCDWVPVITLTSRSPERCSG